MAGQFSYLIIHNSSGKAKVCRRALALVAILLILIPLVPVQAVGSVFLVKNILTSSSPKVIQPNKLTPAGNQLFFSASSDGMGQELWKSDGTFTGTNPIKDILPGPKSSTPQNLTHIGGTLYFTAEDGSKGMELWRSDGSTAGTKLVKDINPGPGSAFSGEGGDLLTPVNGKLYFVASDGKTGREVWQSDGTAAGTFLCKDITPGPEDSHPAELTASNGLIFFNNSNIEGERSWWRSDCTSKGTFQLTVGPDPAAAYPQLFTDVHGTLFFVANTYQLWKTDGTQAGMTLVKSIEHYDRRYIQFMQEVDGRLFFFVETERGAFTELWVSDGTSQGTLPVRTFPYNEVRFNFAFVTAAVNGLLFFTMKDQSGYSLWRSDGTSQGTLPVHLIKPGMDSCDRAVSLLNLEGTLYYLVLCGTGRHNLWKSDGTQDGEVLILENQIIDVPARLVGKNGKIYFSNSGNLWTSDGTTAGTHPVKENGAMEEHGSNPHRLTGMENRLYFLASEEKDSYYPTEKVWQSNGRAESTLSLQEPNNQAFAGQLSVVNGNLFFGVGDGNYPTTLDSLWKSDGTFQGTLLLKNHAPCGDAYTYVSLDQFTPVEGILYYQVNCNHLREPRNPQAVEIWKSDGTQEGTLSIFSSSSYTNLPGIGIPEMTGTDGTLFFSLLYDPFSRFMSLWKINNGSSAVMLKEFSPLEEYGSSILSSLTLADEILFFIVDYGRPGMELWKSDGTVNGTELVKSFPPGGLKTAEKPMVAVGKTIFFVANNGHTGLELWKSDGLSEGTVLVKDIRPGEAGSGPAEMVNMGGSIFFRADDGAHGAELWKSDGTLNGTQLVKDINPGEDSSYPAELTRVEGDLVFAASDGLYGYEMWTSDGSADRTTMKQDIWTGRGNSNPAEFTLVDGILYFSAENASTGRELWANPPEGWILPIAFLPLVEQRPISP